MRGEGDISFIISGRKGRIISAPQYFQCFFIHLMIADFIQYINKLRIALTINLFQFNINRRLLFRNFTAKEVGTIIKLLQHLPFIVWNYRRKLVHIADKQYLRSPKRFVVAIPEMAHYGVNGI